MANDYLEQLFEYRRQRLRDYNRRQAVKRDFPATNPDLLRKGDRIRVSYTGVVDWKNDGPRASGAALGVNIVMTNGTEVDPIYLPNRGASFELIERRKPKVEYAPGTVVGADGEVVIVVRGYNGDKTYVRKLFGYVALKELDLWLDAHPDGHTVFFDPKADSRFAKYLPPDECQSQPDNRTYSEVVADGDADR
jgi:hypothetical protein